MTKHFENKEKLLLHILERLKSDLRNYVFAIADDESQTEIERLRGINNFLKDYFLTKKACLVAVMGMDIAGSLGGSFIIETIFNWPGIGRYGTSSMLSNDINSIVGVVVIIGLFFALINIVVDVVTAYLDPRIMMKWIQMVLDLTTRAVYWAASLLVRISSYR